MWYKNDKWKGKNHNCARNWTESASQKSNALANWNSNEPQVEGQINAKVE